MPPADMHEKLLRIYADQYRSSAGYDPKIVLDYDISQLMKEGKTREEAVKCLYENYTSQKIERERKATAPRSSATRAVRGKPSEDENLLAIDPEIDSIEGQVAQLKERITRVRLLFSRGELGGEAYETANRTLMASAEQLIEQLKDKIANLTVLFSKGELSEETYKSAVRKIEENIDRLREEKEAVDAKETRRETPETENVPIPLSPKPAGTATTKARKMHEARILTILGAILVLVTFLMPWIKLPLLGSLNIYNLCTMGFAANSGEAFIQTLMKSDSSFALSFFLYLLSLIGAILSLSISKKLSIITPLAGFANISSGLLWVSAVEARRANIFSMQLIIVEYGPYVAVLGGCMMIIGYAIESHTREEVATETMSA